MEHRIEHRLRHIGSKLIAAQLVEEGADILGLGNSFVTRLGERAIEGFMMGGAVGAASFSTMAIIHQLAEIVKGHGEEMKKLREQAIKQAEEAKAFAFELRDETRRQQAEQEEKSREILEQFRQAVQQENLNVQRYVTQPYLGAIG